YRFIIEYFQNMHALIFAVEEINSDPELLPNITLGYQVFDTCFTSREAARGTLLMLSGGNEITPNYHCHKGAPLAVHKNLISVSFCFQISYFATSPVLNDRDLFPSFFRTISNDEYQMRGLAQLIFYFGWTWVGLLADDDDYGQHGLQMVKEELNNGGACVAFTEYILTGQADRDAPRLVQVLQKSTAKIVIVISSNFVVVVEELLRQNVTGKIFMATEAWATLDLLSEPRYQGILTGTIAFACKWPTDETLAWTDNVTIKACTGNENPESVEAEDYQRASLNVYTAVYAIAWALQNMVNCRPGTGPFSGGSCANISSFQAWQLLHYIKNVNFKTKDGSQIFFDAKGNPPAIYDVVNWHLGAEGAAEHITVGTYDLRAPDGNTLKVDSKRIVWINGDTQVPVSKCSPSCSPGFRKVIVSGKPLCCYECARCPQGQISNQTDAAECHPCSWDTWPNLQQDRCLPRPTEFLSFGDPLGFSLTGTAIFSSLIPLLILRVFTWFKKTPIVKANNYSLSCLLLLSLFLCFLCSLGFIGYPQLQQCLLRQVAFGLVFALCISCVLAKTITVVIAFNATKPGSRLRKWTGVKVSYPFILICTLIQLCVCVLWLFVIPPFPELDTDTKPGVIIVNCNEGSPTAFWCMLGYLGLLASISFIVAFLARRLPDSFNEAKLITFSMLAFLSVWVSFIPAYLSARGMYTVAMEVFAILSSSWAVLGCIFVPKCYIVLFRPNMNTKGHLLGKSKSQK
uniref:G-protein coupled receptors family 3 profile domain-containing protein n=1 Tax=Xenopus tropicalis TaxID=8364 RepID=A0A6I8QK17_XENTR